MTKKEILQQLADGCISKKQASEMLAELGQVPVYKQPPPHLPPQTKPQNNGCLFAVIGLIILIILSLIFFTFFFLYAGQRVRVKHNTPYTQTMLQKHRVIR